MSTYSVYFSSPGTTRAVAPSEPCVLAPASVGRQLNSDAAGNFDFATPAGGNTFSIFRIGAQGQSSGIFSLVRATMASSACGASVLLDDGSGRWRLGTVVSDGEQVLLLDGSTVATSAPAAVADPASGGSLPSVGTPMFLLGTASDGKHWFSARGRSIVEFGTYVTLPPSTVGGITPGTTAVVQSAAGWVVAQL